MENAVAPMRSVLFVPGNRPERFSKACNSGADAYCIDLEDAVPGDEKALARQATVDFINLREAGDEARVPLYIRINSLSTLEGLRDIVALAEQLVPGYCPEGVVMPMTSSGFEVRQVASLLSSAGSPVIFPMIETPSGLQEIEEIVSASDRVRAVGFGMADYTAITGGEISWDGLLYARSRIVEAASVLGIQSIDGPWFDLADTDGLSSDASRLAGLGFSGKFAIHPSQVGAINDAFTPSRERVRWARKVMRQWELGGGGVVTVAGVMIDQPMVTRARRVLALAREVPEGGGD